MFGGAETVGTTLILGTFYLIENLQLLDRLKEELWSVWPSLDVPPSLERLEKLPFLASNILYDLDLDSYQLTAKQTAVIRESLRISPGVSSPLLRVVPSGGAAISGYQVPSGVSKMLRSFILAIA